MAFPKIGNMAPAFTLLDQDGNKVSLKQFRGEKNVVLYFYPKAMTPGCTVQACGIRDSKKELAKLDTVVLGAWGLKKFMGREFMGVLRTTFIIGKDGRLKHVMEKVKTKSHHDDVIELIKELGLDAA